MLPMRNLISITLGVVVTAFVLVGVIWLMWWLLVVAAVVAVAGLVWRAVTQR
jgi:hypothetical protein